MIDLKRANLFGFVMLALVFLVSTIVWKVVWGDETRSAGQGVVQGPWVGLMVLGTVLLGFVVHELIHGLTWAHYAREGWECISFGIKWKMLTPYCHCSAPLQLNQYMTGCLMPLWVLGVAPWVIGFCLGWGMMVAFGALMIASAAGDIMVAWKLRQEDASAMVMDHPSEIGCIIYEK